MKKGEKHGLEAIGAIVIIFLIAMQMGYLTQYGFPPANLSGTAGNGGQQINTGQTAQDYQNGIGVFQVNMAIYDSADPTIVYYPGTQANIRWWQYVGGSWIPAGTYTNGTTFLFDAKTTDGGYGYFSVACGSSYDYYVDYQKIRASDPYIVGYQYVDAANSGQRQFIFQYDLKDHSIPNSGYPALPINVYLIAYGTPTVNAPASGNVTGIGATDTTKWAETYLSIGTAKQGIGIYKIEIKMNETTLTLARLKNMLIPGIGLVDGSAFTQTQTDTYTKWTYTMSTGFNGADYVIRQPLDPNKYYMTQQWEFNLGTTSIGETVTLYYLIAPTEAGTSTAGIVGFAP